MKLIRNFFLVFIIYAFCSSCKSSKMAYDFPSVGEKKGLRGFSDRLSEKWTKTRVKWSEKEDEKFNRMFERFKGDW